MVMDTIRCKVKDAETRELKEIHITISDSGVGISFPGYGNYSSEVGFVEQVFIEYIDGDPRVYIWGDITIDDPTDTIYLDGADEKFRKD